MSENNRTRTYLGDGVYVEIEDGMFLLWTLREDGKHFIYLEPDVYAALVKFAQQWIK